MNVKFLFIVLLFSTSLWASVEAKRAELYAQLTPYQGLVYKGVETHGLKGKVMCGYQGWFSAEGDGANRKWTHYSAKGKFEPGHCTIDLWPDMSEMEQDEKFKTSFVHRDGSPAYVFSPFIKKTVVRHFSWMKEYGLDGIFLQRFGVTIKSVSGLRQRNVVTQNVQAGANQYGRTWAMMYDLSGMKKGEIKKYIQEDWKQLVDRLEIKNDPSYLHHDGKPVLAIWGVGFNDGRDYLLEECRDLLQFLKHDPKYGNLTLMLGVPVGWRSLDRDALKTKQLHDIIKMADIVSPWNVGRYHSPKSLKGHIEHTTKKDLKWTQEEGLEYMPVIFPGFSWHNLKKSLGEKAPLRKIPRLKGDFFWSQAYQFKKAGAEMLYVAMFDEIDEGTAIFKCTNDPPVGKSSFLDYEGLPSDHYLWLTGQIKEMMIGTIICEQNQPQR